MILIVTTIRIVFTLISTLSYILYSAKVLKLGYPINKITNPLKGNDNSSGITPSDDTGINYTVTDYYD